MRSTLVFSMSDYVKHVEHYRQNWTITDNALYSLCQNNFSHDSMNSINAKLWIIGRAYATGIERKIKTNGYQGGSLSQLAQHLYKNRNAVNEIIEKLRSISSDLSLTAAKLEVIVSLHGEFVGLIKEITRANQSTRSFVSKYMHFHCPIVPIYDSNASRVINKIMPWNNGLMAFKKDEIADEDYLWFALRFWKLYRMALEVSPDVTVKHLDYYLLCVADGLVSSRQAAPG